MKKAMLCVLATLLGVVGCKDEQKGLSKGQVKDLWEQVSDSEYIRVRGIGAVPAGVVEQTKRRGLSRNAALASARYEMLAILKGLRLSGGITVGQLVQTDGEIKESAERIVAAAEEKQVEWAKDDGCVVLLELRRDKVEEVLRKTSAYEQKP